MNKTPILPANDTARAQAWTLLEQADHAALAFTHPESGAPFVSRIGIAQDANGWPFSPISALALHARALARQPECALLIGTAPPKGDPLAFPRLSLAAVAEPAPGKDQATLRSTYLKSHRKAAIYLDLPDFRFIRFRPTAAALNAGFGKAYHLTAADLTRTT